MGRTTMLLMLSTLVTWGCTSDHPVAPSRFPVIVEISPTSTVFAQSENVTVILRNRSSGTVYLEHTCFPLLERQNGQSWADVVLAPRVACAAVYVPPVVIGPDKTASVVLVREYLAAPLPAGQYRFRVLVGASGDSFASYWSGAFTVSGE
jgi:hypothetical protein